MGSWAAGGSSGWVALFVVASGAASSACSAGVVSAAAETSCESAAGGWLSSSLGLGVTTLARVQRHCAMVTFADKRYDKLFQAVTHKHGERALNYIKRFHKDKTMAASVGNRYSEEDLMQTFVDNFQSPGKYAAQQAQQLS